MDEKSTFVKSDVKEEVNPISIKGVSGKTIDFLKLFARSYRPETSLNVNQSIISLN